MCTLQLLGGRHGRNTYRRLCWGGRSRSEPFGLMVTAVSVQANFPLPCCPQMATSSWRSSRMWPETTPTTPSSASSGLTQTTSLWFCFLFSFTFQTDMSNNHSLTTWFISTLQLTTYWEKTFKLDLFRPQIGVVNVTDVSECNPNWDRYLISAFPNFLDALCSRRTVCGWTCPTTRTCPLQRSWRTG